METTLTEVFTIEINETYSIEYEVFCFVDGEVIASRHLRKCQIEEVLTDEQFEAFENEEVRFEISEEIFNKHFKEVSFYTALKNLKGNKQ